MISDLYIIDWTAISAILTGISAIVLAATAYFIFRQTQATKQLAESAISPAVDFMMFYQKDNSGGEGTRFQFLNVKQNFSDLWIEVTTNCNKQCTDSHFNGAEPFHLYGRTYATNYIPFFKELIDENPSRDVEIWLNIFLSPVYNKKPGSVSYKKRYRFDRAQKDWIDNDWGISDKNIFTGLRSST